MNIPVKKTNVDKAKEKIYFEKQEGRLCGQHCINNALQMKVFDAVTLSTIAQGLDEEERKRMAEQGTDTREYLEFISKPSSNYDDSGYFSVQVLAQALKTFNLDLINWKSDADTAKKARVDPVAQRLFICHTEDHWLAIRRFGPQWFNLNSVKKEPEPLSDTYLSVFLETVQTEGYIIFVVTGDLPRCPADEAFSALKRGPDGKFLEEPGDPGHRLGTSSSSSAPTEDELLKRGIELSLAKTPAEAIRKQREQFLKRFGGKPSEEGTPATNNDKTTKKDMEAGGKGDNNNPSIKR